MSEPVPESVEEKPKLFPTLTIEIHGEQIVVKYIVTPETNAALFSVFLHRLNRGDYQTLLTSSLLNAGQQLNLTGLTNKIVEQFLVMQKSQQIGMRPRDTLKSKGE